VGREEGDKDDPMKCGGDEHLAVTRRRVAALAREAAEIKRDAEAVLSKLATLRARMAAWSKKVAGLKTR